MRHTELFILRCLVVGFSRASRYPIFPTGHELRMLRAFAIQFDPEDKDSCDNTSDEPDMAELAPSSTQDSHSASLRRLIPGECWLRLQNTCRPLELRALEHQKKAMVRSDQGPELRIRRIR